MWKHPYAQVIFDSDPTPMGRAGPAHVEEMSQAIIRSVVMTAILCLLITDGIYLFV